MEIMWALFPRCARVVGTIELSLRSIAPLFFLPPSIFSSLLDLMCKYFSLSFLNWSGENSDCSSPSLDHF